MFRNRFLRTKVRKIRFEDVRSNLEDDDQLFGFLEKAMAGRSLPSREMIDDNDLDPGMVDVFLKVLWNGSIVFNSRDSAMVRCFRMGFIHTEAISGKKTACVLPSPIHARYVNLVGL